VLRLAGIYGPGRLHLVNQVRAGEVSGRGEHHLNLAHRDDIAAAVWACFVAPPEIKNEILNVADDGAARKADVVAWLAARLGKPVPRFTGVAAEGRAAVTPDRIVSSRKLKTLLDWRPRFPSFRAGYENMLSEEGK
jgi:nucleoside-diphosphate-sugar epimerase